MKAYSFKLKKNDMFIIHFLNDEIATLATDELNPCPPTDVKWIKSSNTIIRLNDFPHKLHFSTCLVEKEDINYFLNLRIIEEVKNHIGKNYNLYILQKEWTDFIEIGIGCYTGYGKEIHEYGQSIIDRYLNLKAFW